ncbi:hypothetical protein ACFRKD_03815 [Streptomyces niveus]|uniref:hypothetical protein n=1 Tax=Streptomyces niveus TaxID=193462 RepID=UPI0036AD3392
MTSTVSGAVSSKKRGRTMARRTSTVSVALAALLLLAGCGSDAGSGSGSGSVPEGWGTLKTPAVTVAHPAAFEAQSAGERSKYNAAAATLSDESGTIGMITVQLDFTDADSVEEAAIGAEAGVALGSTLGKQEEIQVAGPDGGEEARRVNFGFTQKDSGTDAGAGTPGGALDPKAGTRVEGVIIAGLDADDKTYAVRIDAVKGKLSKGDLRKIIDSITVN